MKNYVIPHIASGGIWEAMGIDVYLHDTHEQTITIEYQAADGAMANEEHVTLQPRAHHAFVCAAGVRTVIITGPDTLMVTAYQTNTLGGIAQAPVYVTDP